jgi:polyhydroxyalkanoate synthesis regulator phasin
MADAEVDIQVESPPQAVADDPAGETQPDTQAQPVAGQRTYTQGEVDTMRAETDRQDNSLKSALAQYALREQVRVAQDRESQSMASDQQLVDGGTLTQEQATQRSQDRIARIQTDVQATQERNNVQTMGEQLGRVAASQDFAKKFNVDADVLANDASLTTPELMEAKAHQLQLDKREAKLTGTETFDRGLQGGRSVAVDDMSGMEKIRFALGHPPKGQPKL